MTVSFIAPGSLFSAFAFCPNAPFFLLCLSLVLVLACFTVPGELDAAMKMVQAARGGGKKLGLGGRGGKAGGVSKGKDAPPSYYAATEGHKGSRRRDGKKGGYGKRVTYCYQCGGGW